MTTPDAMPHLSTPLPPVSRVAWWGARTLTLVLIAMLGVAYWWLACYGRLDHPLGNRGYYSMMADGFSNYRLSLLEDPVPSLLALPDPYDPAQNGEHRLHDASLYKDRSGAWRYALYWGPTPALMIMAQRHLPAWARVPESDTALMLYFAVALLAASTAVLIWVRETFHRSLPWSAVAWAVPVVGLVAPIPFFVARPAIYEAAIIGGQAFLMAGIFLAARGLHALAADERAATPAEAGLPNDVGPAPPSTSSPALSSPSSSLSATSSSRFPARRWAGPAWLLAAGAAWAAAVGTRQSLAVAVVGLSGLVGTFLLARFARERRGPAGPRAALRRGLVPLACLAGPLVATAVGLCAINYARFGNPLEFGVKYQLAGVYPQKMMDAGVYSSAQYVWPNLSRYLLDKPDAIGTFPFLTAVGPDAAFFKKFPVLPPGYGGEQVAGILWCSPMLLFGVLPPLAALATIARGRRPSTEAWLAIMLATAGWLALAVTLFPVGSTMRYLIEFVPCAAVLAVMGMWQWARWCARRGRPAYALVGIGSVLVAWSLGVSLLLGVSGYASNLERHNPEVFGRLQRLFS